jgi:hypothetical protein
MQPNAKPPTKVNWLAVLGAVLTLITGLVVGVSVSSNEGPDHVVTHHVTVSITRNVPPPTAPAGDLAGAGTTDPNGAPAAQSPLRDETPPDVPKSELHQGEAKTRSLGKQLPDQPQPVGGAQGFSVRKDFSGHVYSDFPTGVKPTEFCVHYTVSPNIAGWGDVLSIQSLFKRTMAASATFIGDFEAHFLQMVPLDHKAWTQGTFNPKCRASIELIATGRETRAQWLASPLFKRAKLAALVSDVMKRYGIPRRFVDPSGCVAPPGWTDHNHIECGNDHLDVSPVCAFNNAVTGHPLYPSFHPAGCTGFPFDVFRRQLADAARFAVSKLDQLRCSRLNHWRKAGRPLAGTRPAVLRKHTLAAHHVDCTIAHGALLA